MGALEDRWTERSGKVPLVELVRRARAVGFAPTSAPRATAETAAIRAAAPPPPPSAHGSVFTDRDVRRAVELGGTPKGVADFLHHYHRGGGGLLTVAQVIDLLGALDGAVADDVQETRENTDGAWCEATGCDDPEEATTKRKRLARVEKFIGEILDRAGEAGSDPLTYTDDELEWMQRFDETEGIPPETPGEVAELVASKDRESNAKAAVLAARTRLRAAVGDRRCTDELRALVQSTAEGLSDSDATYYGKTSEFADKWARGVLKELRARTKLAAAPGGAS